MQCEYYALEGLAQLYKTISLVKQNLNRNLQIEGLVFSMVDQRANLTLQVIEEVKKFLKDKVYDTVIPRNIRLAEAPSHGKPIASYDKTSKGAEAYEKLAREFLSRNEAKSPLLPSREKSPDVRRLAGSLGEVGMRDGLDMPTPEDHPSPLSSPLKGEEATTPPQSTQEVQS